MSSSAHLVIFQQLFGLKEPALFFNIVLHIATLLATLIIFRKAVVECFKNPRAVLLLITAVIPTAAIGFFLLDTIEKSFGSISIAGSGLLITGSLLWLTRKISPPITSSDSPLFSNISFINAFIIGCSQGISLFPGISRSGTTISIALFLKIPRQDAANFSFLLSIPSILGALMLKSLDMSFETLQIPQLLAGFSLSFVIGILALIVLVKIVLQGRFFKFSYYCWAVGLGTVLMGLFA